MTAKLFTLRPQRGKRMVPAKLTVVPSPGVVPSALPNGQNPTVPLTDREVQDMIGDVRGLANRLRSGAPQPGDTEKAADWLTFMANVFTARL